MTDVKKLYAKVIQSKVKVEGSLEEQRLSAKFRKRAKEDYKKVKK